MEAKRFIEELKNAAKCAHTQDGEALSCTAEWLEMVLDEFCHQQAEIDLLTIENWQLKGALGYPVPGNIIEGDWINGIAEARDAEIDRLNRAYEVLEATLEGIRDYKKVDILSHASAQTGLSLAQKIKNGKDGEQE